MASKTSFYNNSGVTNEQSNAIDASVSNAEANATSASNSATSASNSATAAANSTTSASNSASSASASATTATASKDAAVVAKDASVVAKDAAVVAKDAAVVAKNAAESAVSASLAKSNNLSDLTNASTARTNLGVAIGSNVQAYSSVLQSTTAAYTSALNTKLSGIEANATADQTKSDIDALGINATQVSGFTVGVSVPSNALFTDTNTTYSVGDGGLTQNNFTNADHTKLDGIEASADVTDTANVVAALTAGTNITIAANGTIASTASGGGGGSSYTHPNHSGEVTSSGDGATVISSNVVDADNLKVTGNGSNTQFLRSDGDGTFTWATPVDTNTTYSIGDGGLTTNDFTNADHSKLNAIEAGATADQTNAEIRAAVEAASDSNVFTDADHTKLNGIATGATAYTNANAISAVTASDLDMGGNKVLFSNVYSAFSDLPSASSNHGMFAHVHATGKGYYAHGGNWIELANASDIVTYTVQDGQLSQNNFTDADHSKLNAIESNATADQTASEIRTLVESATDSNVFTDADHTKLNAVEASADVTDTANVVAALTAGTNVSIAANGTISSTDTNTTYSVGDGGLTTNDFTNADHTKLDGIATSANNYTHPNHSGEVTSTADGATVIADNVVDEANLKVSNTPTNGYVLTAQSGNTGGLTWAAAASGGGGGADLYTANESSPAAQPSATGTNAIAIGDSAISTNTKSFALGRGQASGIDSFAAQITNISTSYGASGANSIAMGDRAKASGSRGIAIGGYNPQATGASTLAFGYQALASSSYASGMGYASKATGQYSWASNLSLASANYATALGISDNSSSYGAQHINSVAIGYRAVTTAGKQIALGDSTAQVKISGAYTLPTADGTNGQVLTTDGSGAVTFATPASGGGGADLYDANESSPAAQPSATGTNAIAIGDGAIASGQRSIALGWGQSSGQEGVSIAIDSNTTNHGAKGVNSIAMGKLAVASNTSCVAIGQSASASTNNSIALGVSSVAAGLRATALTNSYASGADSFAAAIANNSTSYGASGANSIAIGANAKATNAKGIALGNFSWATGTTGSLSIGDYSRSSQSYATAYGYDAVANGPSSTAIGHDTTATGSHSTAIGSKASSPNIGQFSISNNGSGWWQSGTWMLAKTTTNATADKLSTNALTASTNNQVVLPNDSCYGFTGTVIAREDSSATNDFAIWEIKGGAVRGASASTTALGTYNINKISESTGATNWSIALSADTTNGAVAITVTGEASHNIRWVATVNTTEVTY